MVLLVVELVREGMTVAAQEVTLVAETQVKVAVAVARVMMAAAEAAALAMAVVVVTEAVMEAARTVAPKVEETEVTDIGAVMEAQGAKGMWAAEARKVDSEVVD